jgi:hypothetical protein
MSHFSSDARSAARRGSSEDFVKVSVGERMRFQITKIGKVQNVPDAPNGPFDCLPFEIVCLEHVDSGGRSSVPEGHRWEPAADKVEGLIELADSLEAQTGDPDVIFKRNFSLKIYGKKNPKSGRTYHVYEFADDGPIGDARGAAVSPPSPPRGGAVSPPSVSPPAVGGAFVDPFASLQTIEACTAKIQEIWKGAVADKTSTAVAAAFAARKRALGVAALSSSASMEALDAAWAKVGGQFVKDPPGLVMVEEAYKARHAVLSAPPSPGWGAGSDLPDFHDEDIPF